MGRRREEKFRISGQDGKPMTNRMWLDGTDKLRPLLASASKKNTQAVQMFEDLDHRVQVFLNRPVPGTARPALNALKQWRVVTGPTADEEIFAKQSLEILLMAKAIRTTIDAAFDFVMRFLEGPIFQAFEQEADRLLRHFAGTMTDVYARKLQETFIGRNPLQGSEHFKVVKSDRFARQFQLRGGASIQFPISGVAAFTGRPPNDPKDQAPANRVIYLKESWTEPTIFHELLHWCTHEDYELEAKTYKDDDQNNAIIEGVTEYFSRAGHPGRTNFPDQLSQVEAALKGPALTERALQGAYFRGAGVAGVAKIVAASAKPAAAPSWVKRGVS